jgi:hypothetical protein
MYLVYIISNKPIYLKLADRAIRNFYFTIPNEEQELFDERAGILEYEAGFTRGQAEHRAFIELLKIRRAKYNLPE